MIQIFLCLSCVTSNDDKIRDVYNRTNMLTLHFVQGVQTFAPSLRRKPVSVNTVQSEYNDVAS